MCGNLSIRINFYTGELFQQFLHSGTRLSLVGACIVLNGILFHYNFCLNRSHNSLLKHNRRFLKHNWLKTYI